MEYKGQLTGFPDEVVEWMLQNQVKQGNKRDISVFEKNKYAGKESKGFRWKKTIEGFDFWEKVIDKRNFGVFFEKYPKKQHEVKYFKYELDTLSRKALELINKKNTKTVYFGKSQYYYGTDGTCKKTSFGLMKDQIVSPKQIIEMLSEKKEPVKDEVIELEIDIKYKNGKIIDSLKYSENLIINTLKSKDVELLIVRKQDPLFEKYKKIRLNIGSSLREEFNLVKELFNK